MIALGQQAREQDLRTELSEARKDLGKDLFNPENQSQLGNPE
jgi:hypothetical protein